MTRISLLQQSLVALAILTVFGILVHETKTDKALALALPVAAATFGVSMHAVGFGENAHTHVERMSLSHAFAGMPRIQPRDDHKKYLISRLNTNNGDFNGSHILWPSV